MRIPVHVSVLCALCIVVSMLGLTTINPGLTAAAAVSLTAVILAAWRTGEPPALLLVGAMQWLQSATALLRADIEGRALWTYGDSRSIEEATALSLASVVVFVVAARLAMGWRPPEHSESTNSNSATTTRLLLLWLAATIASGLLGSVYFGGLTQVARAMAEVKWVAVFVLFATLIPRPSGWMLVAAVLTAEIGLGFLSFFAGFKRPIYLLAIALLGHQRRFRLSYAVGALVTAAATLFLGVVWTAVKVDYRDYVSGHSGMQTIEVSKEQQASKLSQLVDALDGERLAEAANELAERMAYVEFFGLSMDFVPRIRPHTGGRRLLAALEHVLEPRLLFPDKPVLDDTADTEHYTGLRLKSERQTSISLGYFAEAYVDLGTYLMFLPVAFFGALYGGLAGVLRRQRGHPVVAQGFATVFLMGVATIELGFAKLLGGAIMTFTIFFVMQKAITRFVEPWLFRSDQVADRRKPLTLAN